MSKLYYVRVRRARGLSMPLPPKPKARPLGPPVLFTWKDVDIRVRADIERAGWTWDEFLDGLVAFRDDPGTFVEGCHALNLVERLVPRADLQAHRNDVRRRTERNRAEKVAEDLLTFRESMDPAPRGHGGNFLLRLMGRREW